jgi:hypothetical protein
MSEHLRAGEIVDSNDLDVPATLSNDASDTAPDSTEAIDSDFRSHSFDSLRAATPSEGAAGEGER